MAQKRSGIEALNTNREIPSHNDNLNLFLERIEELELLLIGITVYKVSINFHIFNLLKLVRKDFRID